MKMLYSRKTIIAGALLLCAGLPYVQWRWHFVNFTGLLEVLGAVWTLLRDLPRRMRAPADVAMEKRRAARTRSGGNPDPAHADDARPPQPQSDPRIPANLDRAAAHAVAARAHFGDGDPPFNRREGLQPR
ncbi:MAG: hypothetical protein EPN21_00170 [Methylococcaceae bacterium]|nr:MAG: hypothetical protein EPN21_00170 [Methylococcaceae bacterium]